uniref:Antitoxin n=1 Tax=Archaeoglobus fulgidus TaxID=2234 RepID=A0A7C3R967_ARCFL
MPRIIEAIYENGVFKPLEKVDLREGEKVRIIIEEDVIELAKRYAGIGGYRGKLSQEELYRIEVDIFG